MYNVILVTEITLQLQLQSTLMMMMLALKRESMSAKSQQKIANNKQEQGTKE